MSFFLLEFCSEICRRNLYPAGSLLFAAGRLCGAADLGEDLVLLENQILLVVNFDIVATIFAEQDAIAGFYVERDSFALFPSPRPDSHHFAFLGLLLGRVGDDDASLNGLFLFGPPHEHAIM